MAQRSFWFSLFCLGLACYSLYAYLFMRDSWLLAPPRIVIFILSLLAFIAGIFGFKEGVKGCWLIFRSLVTVFISFLLSLLLLVTLVIPWSEQIKTASSPKHDHQLEIDRLDLGAFTSFSFDVYLKGPLWTKKRIFTTAKRPKVKWLNDDIVSINGHRIQLNRS